MDASEAKSGVKYLSRTGIPVIFKGIKNGKVLLRLETTGTTIAVNGGYELKPIPEPKTEKVAKQGGNAQGKAKVAVKPAAPAPRSLSAFIDPMLLAGGHTVKEIAAEVLKQATEMAKDKDIEANVRARMVSFTRKGCQITKDANKRVKVLQKKAQ